MFEEIIARLQRKKIKLKTDQSLHDKIDARYRSTSPIDFTFTLFNLAYAIGTCRSVAPTKADKFPLAVDFVHLFANSDTNELRITINDTETIEQKQDISKYLGEALSLLIAEKLCGVNKSTIKRIDRKGNESKPDFMGFTPSLKVVWEAKGSTGAISAEEIRHAKDQKARETANIAFVCLAEIKSESMSEVFVDDPPTLPVRGEDLERQLS